MEPRQDPERDIHGAPPADIIAPGEVEARAKEFGVSAEQLRVAMHEVGPVVADVKAFLQDYPKTIDSTG